VNDAVAALEDQGLVKPYTAAGWAGFWAAGLDALDGMDADVESATARLVRELPVLARQSPRHMGDFRAWIRGVKAFAARKREEATKQVQNAAASQVFVRAEAPRARRHPANFGGLVLGCIEANFCKKICV